MLNQWKNTVENFTIQHETAITAFLVAVAVVLVLVALFGKPHHKALAMLYIVC